MPHFEVYERHHVNRPYGPTVTLTARGAISFSTEALDLLGKPEAVKLLYDEGDRIIGFKPARKGDKNAYTLRLSGKYSQTVSAAPFCRLMGIEGNGAQRWPLAMDDGIGCVDLKQPGIPVTRREQG